MNAIILCAGEGVRMKPVTDHIPKPLLPMVGSPLINRTLDRLYAQGIDKVGVNTHHKADLLQQHLATYGKPILVSHELVLLGTGGALRFFEDFVSEEFLVHSGDIVTNADIMDILAFHNHHEPMITLALIRNEKVNNISIDEDQNVVEIATTIRSGRKDYYTFSGISVFSKRVFSFLPEREVFSMVEIFHNVQRSGGNIKGYPCSMTWYNINSCKALWKLHQDILDQSVAFDGITTTAPHFIDPTSTVKTKNIKGFVSVGEQCIVEEGVEMENTILFNGTHLAQGSYRNCLVSNDFCVQVNQG